MFSPTKPKSEEYIDEVRHAKKFYRIEKKIKKENDRLEKANAAGVTRQEIMGASRPFGLVLIEMNRFKKSATLGSSYSSGRSLALSSILSGSDPNESLGELDKSFLSENSKGCSAKSLFERSFLKRKASEKSILMNKVRIEEVSSAPLVRSEEV